MRGQAREHFRQCIRMMPSWPIVLSRAGQADVCIGAFGVLREHTITREIRHRPRRSTRTLAVPKHVCTDHRFFVEGLRFLAALERFLDQRIQVSLCVREGGSKVTAVSAYACTPPFLIQSRARRIPRHTSLPLRECEPSRTAGNPRLPRPVRSLILLRS